MANIRSFSNNKLNSWYKKRNKGRIYHLGNNRDYERLTKPGVDVIGTLKEIIQIWTKKATRDNLCNIIFCKVVKPETS